MARTLAQALVELRGDASKLGADVDKAGTDAGRRLGDAITRGADGRLRDAKGKFVASIDASVGAAAEEGGRKAANSVTKSMAGISFGGVIKQAAGFAAVLGAGGVAGEAVKMGITTAASLEQAQVGFTTLLGSGQKAKDFLSRSCRRSPRPPRSSCTAWSTRRGCCSVSGSALSRSFRC
jgi:hypothetical protein